MTSHQDGHLFVVLVGHSGQIVRIDYLQVAV